MKAGKEILVGDLDNRGSRDEDGELLALASQGKLRLGKGVVEESFWDTLAPGISAATLRHVLDAERNED
jgi:hypothetical protein